MSTIVAAALEHDGAIISTCVGCSEILEARGMLHRRLDRPINIDQHEFRFVLYQIKAPLALPCSEVRSQYLRNRPSARFVPIGTFPIKAKNRPKVSSRTTYTLADCQREIGARHKGNHGEQWGEL